VRQRDRQFQLRHRTGQGQADRRGDGIKNSAIVQELNLPPVKIHCSVLAEDAIKAAITDWKHKHESAAPQAGSSQAVGSSDKAVRG